MGELVQLYFHRKWHKYNHSIKLKDIDGIHNHYQLLIYDILCKHYELVHNLNHVHEQNQVIVVLQKKVMGHILVVDMLHQVQNYYQFLYHDDVFEYIIDLMEDNFLVRIFPYLTFLN